MKRLLLLSTLLLLAVACSKTTSENEEDTVTMSYRSKSEKIDFKVARNEYFVTGPAEVLRKVQEEENKERENGYRYLTATSGVIREKVLIGTFNLRLREIRRLYPNLEHVEPVLLSTDGTRHLLQGGVLVKVLAGTDPAKLGEVTRRFNKVEKVAGEENVYLLTSGMNTQQIFEAVTTLSRLKDVVWAEPNFTKLPNRFINPLPGTQSNTTP